MARDIISTVDECDPNKPLIQSLKRVEGQVRALQTQVESGKDTVEILTQMAAATGALQSAARRFLYARTDKMTEGEELQEAIERLLKV